MSVIFIAGVFPILPPFSGCKPPVIGPFVMPPLASVPASPLGPATAKSFGPPRPVGAATIKLVLQVKISLLFIDPS